MTLYKQLIILILVLFIGLLLSVFYISANNLRDYINSQLSSHAQDAATSLGIAISSEMVDKDQASIETHVNAMFDSGYYRKIEITDSSDQVLIIKQRALTEMDSIPDWLIRLLPLATPQEKAVVMNGWSLAGTIKITSFPEFAYQNLWNNIKSIFSLFTLIVLTLFLLTSFALRALLKPLSEIEQQASAISKRHFTTLDINPGTIEFKRVVAAMNKMSGKLKAIFKEQAELTEALQIRAFQDKVTGLPNRSVFMKQLKYYTQLSENQYQGCLLILQVGNLDEINKKRGHLAGDQLLIAIAELFNKLSEDYPQSFVARISGTEFAIIIRSISPDKLHQLGKNLENMLKNICSDLDFEKKDIAHSGIIQIYPGQTMVTMLSEADMALRLAQQKGQNAYHIYDEDQEGLTVYGASQWNDIIIESIANNHFELHCQNVVDGEFVVLHKEVMIRLHHKEQLISAGIFIPMAEHLGITHRIDQWVIKRVLSFIETDNSHNSSEVIYSINLSQDAITDPDFPDWLKRQLIHLTLQQLRQIIFEVPEYHVNKYASEVKNLLVYLENIQCHFCIDHFGIDFSNMNYLNELNIDFIKIHGSYADNIQDNPDVSTYLRQVVSMAHSLDIKVIAEGIEGEKELEILKSLKVDLFQGYYIGHPKAQI